VAPLRLARLETYARVASVIEKHLIDKQDLISRQDHEIFKIVTGRHGEPEGLAPLDDDDNQGRVNSAYNYAVSKGAYFWANNNLLEMEKDEKYYNSSKRWIDYYKSSAVFLIAPPLSENDDALEFEQFLGIIIFYDRRNGAFEYSVSKFVVGYLAHCVRMLLWYGTRPDALSSTDIQVD
jgi:hypothetical protein